jgi:ligand-binding sensor domain-containing protein/signal transduction histidine kinase
MKETIRSILISLIAVLFATAISPNPVLETSRYSIIQSPENKSKLNEITAEDFEFERIILPGGVTSKILQSIAQDQQGFIWIGTEGGLYKYDGFEFTLYPQDNNDSVSIVNDIEEILIDSQNMIWLGTPQGLFRFDRTKNSYISYHDAYIFSILEDSQGVLWISASDDLFHYNPEKDELDRWAFSNYGPVLAMYESKDGVLWLGTPNGLIRYQADKTVGENISLYQHSSQNSNSISGNVITSIVEDADGNLWVGTEKNGVNRLSLKNQERAVFERFTHQPDGSHSLDSNTVTSMVADQSGNLWVGTLNGLNRYDQAVNQFVHLDSGEFDQYFSGIIMDLFVDQSGLLWVGTIGSLDKMDITAHRFIPYANPIIQDQIILARFIDQNGDHWFGTLEDGLYKISTDLSSEQYIHDPNKSTSLSHNSVRSIFRDSQDILWVGTENGLNIFNPQTKNFTQDPRFAGHQITVIFEDPTGRLWIGTSQGLFNSLRTIRRFSRLRSEYVTDIEAAENGEVWLGTVNGLYLVNPYGQSIKFYNYETPKSLANDWVNEIYKDSNGNLWIGTGEGGVNRFEPATETFTQFSEEDGLLSNTVYCILGDENENIWIGTDRGVTMINPKSGIFHNYDSKDGLSGDEVIGCFRNKSGEISFVGLHGLSLLGSDGIKNNLHQPEIVITAFKKFNQIVRTDLANDEEIQLMYDDNFVSFEFAALDYVQPEKNQFAYKMEGLDDEWVYAKTRRFADYPDLKPGEYTFRVIGSNNDGIWNELGTAVHIIVTPPFWLRWWFWGLIGLGIIGVVSSGYFLRVRSLENRSRELEEQVFARTAEINQRRQEIEALYRADQELYRHLNLDQVLQALVDTSLEILNADKGNLLVWDETRENLTVRASSGFSGETLDKISFSPNQGVAGLVGVTGKPIVVENALTDPRVTRSIVDNEGIHSFIQVPIIVGEEVFGVFSADFTKPHHFSKEEQRLLISLAQRTGMAIENARLYEQAEELGILKERNRLARDLHDSITQAMYSITMYADAASRRLSEGQINVASDHMRKLRIVIKDALRDLRLLIFELRPQILKKEGLVSAIEARLDAVENRSGFQINFSVQGENNLPYNLEEGLYYFALEALTNALKHAQADSLHINLQFDQRAAILEILDDGIGFVPDSMRESGGLGIRGMMERAKDIGAILNITSEPGKGTRVLAKVEFENETEIDRCN